MRLIKYVLLCLVLFSCSDDNGQQSENSEFLGKWKMTEKLIDPGDGSGVYEPVTGDFFLEFFANGNVTSNYMLCTLTGTSVGDFTSPYSEEGQYIQSETCNASQPFQIDYEMQGENLILIYPCIEACLVKFVRID